MPYLHLCPNCNKEYSTKDKRQIYCSRGCWNEIIKVSPNFKGKHHTEETIKILSTKCRIKSLGEDNPFYGKTHSKETKSKLSFIGKQRRKEYSKELLEQDLKVLGKTQSYFEDLYEELVSTDISMTKLAQNTKLHRKTLEKYFLLFCCSKQELKAVLDSKRRNSFISKPEKLLYLLLCCKFGKDNIQCQYKLEGKFYDFLLFNYYLLEYDGFYWHQYLGYRDEMKDKIASNAGFPLLRIVEPEIGEPDFLGIIDYIEEFIYKNEISKD